MAVKTLGIIRAATLLNGGKDMGKIKIGFAPTRRNLFSAPDAIKYRNLN